MVELSAKSAEAIKNAIITNIFYYEMTDDFLKKYLIAFFSDGASTMLGRKAGVSTKFIHFTRYTVYTVFSGIPFTKII
jgi:hypothetical protein